MYHILQVTAFKCFYFKISSWDPWPDGSSLDCLSAICWTLICRAQMVSIYKLHGGASTVLGTISIALLMDQKPNRLKRWVSKSTRRCKFYLEDGACNLLPYKNYGFSENDGEVNESPYSNNLYETTYQNYEYQYKPNNKVSYFNFERTQAIFRKPILRWITFSRPWTWKFHNMYDDHHQAIQVINPNRAVSSIYKVVLVKSDSSSQINPSFEII